MSANVKEGDLAIVTTTNENGVVSVEVLESITTNHKAVSSVKTPKAYVKQKFDNKNSFNKKIDELNQETEVLIDEIEKWQT